MGDGQPENVDSQQQWAAQEPQPVSFDPLMLVLCRTMSLMQPWSCLLPVRSSTVSLSSASNTSMSGAQYAATPGQHHWSRM